MCEMAADGRRTHDKCPDTGRAELLVSSQVRLRAILFRRRRVDRSAAVCGRPRWQRVVNHRPQPRHCRQLRHDAAAQRHRRRRQRLPAVMPRLSDRQDYLLRN